ncbi:hypothetical protein BU23DRAFT_477914, partial [Bimuria novae-zelandiae CBS 107.79]
PDLAAWIAHDPDGESYVFCKFDRLSARNLLNMQSQLIELERQIDEWDEAARRSQDLDLRLSVQRWETFEDNATDSQRPEFKRKELDEKLKKQLREYDETLLLQSQVSNLDQPSDRVFHAFDSFLNKPQPLLSGRAKKMLEGRTDLVALRPPPDTDPLSRLLRNHWPVDGSSVHEAGSNTAHFHEHHVKRLVLFITMLVAAVLLIGAIVSLYFVKRPTAKLGMIACFTTLFSISVGSLTSAKRQEVFAASAAYAAVLIVFVSGDFDKD